MKGLFRRKVCDQKIPQRKWTDLVPEVQLAMNQKVHSATNSSPFQLMYGLDKRHDTLKPQLQDNLIENQDHNQEERKISKQEFIKEAQTNLEASAEKMKKQYDKTTSEKHLLIGDKVYIKREYVKKGMSKKLSTVYDNLSTVIEDNHPIYKVKQIGSGKVGWIHHNRLRRKETLSSPNAEFKLINHPKGAVELPASDFDDSYSEIDLPLVIHNSGIIRENELQDNEPEMTDSLENPTNNTDLPEDFPLIYLEGEQPPMINDQETLHQPTATADQMETGLKFNEDGRRISTRTKRTTQQADFKY